MKDITLIQAVGAESICIEFSTIPSISNKRLKNFYNYVSKILKRLDPEINYESKFYEWRVKGLLFRSFRKYSRLEKSLQVIDETKKGLDKVIRTNNLIYHKEAPEISEDIKRYAERNPYGDILITRPNIEIHSTVTKYNPHDLISELKKLNYVEIPDNFENFNPLVPTLREGSNTDTVTTKDILKPIEIGRN